jgi:hypothetical protein
MGRCPHSPMKESHGPEL